MRRLVLALVLVLAWAGTSEAATYYASKVGAQWKIASGAWPTSGSDNCSANSISGCLTTTNANNTLVLDNGTYSGADIGTNGLVSFTAAGQTMRGAISSDPYYSSHNGTLTFDGTSSTTTAIVGGGAQAGWTLRGIRLINAQTNIVAVTMSGSGTVTRCVFQDNYRHLQAGATASSTSNVTLNEFIGAATIGATDGSDVLMAAGTGTVNVTLNIFRPKGITGGDTAYGYGPSIGIAGTGTYNIYNNTFAGTQYAITNTVGTPASGTTNIKNNVVIGAGAASNSTGRTVACPANHTCVVANNSVSVSSVAPVAPY